MASTSKTSRAASALKSGVGGVVLGGTAIFSAMNGFTPHMAGAIDIMVVEQPDGSLKCSPFYVRFGKYTPMRAKDKVVRISVNGEEAAFSMHLGAYGQAYFAAETTEIVSDASDDEDMLSGMMSPPSGYSSGDEGAPYANMEILSAINQEAERLKRGGAAAAAAGEGAGAAAGAGEGAAAAAAGGGEDAGKAGSGEAGAPAGGESSPSRPRSRLAHASAGQGGGKAARSGEDSGAESSSELSDSSEDGSTAGPPAAAPPAAGAAPPPLPPLPPTSPHLQRRRSGTSAGGAAPAAAAEAAAASLAAKAATLAAPAAGSIEDMLLDSKYGISSVDSAHLLEQRAAERQAPGHDRAQHAWAVKRRSSVAQAGAQEVSRLGGAAAAVDDGAAGGAGVAEAAGASTAAEGGDAAAALLSQAPAAAAVAEDAAVLADTPHASGKAGAEQQQLEQPQPQLEQQPAGGRVSSSSSSSSEAGEEVTSALSPVHNGKLAPPPGLLSSSISKARDAAAAAAAAAVTAVTAAGPAAPQPAASQPVPITGSSGGGAARPDVPLGVSPADTGYLADSEGPRGTSGGGAVAADAAAAAAAAAGAVPAAHSGPMALGGAGFQMSLCGHLLRRGTPAAEALQVFEAHRVTAAAWGGAAGALAADPSLVVRVGGALYPWSAAAPMVLGMLAFGGSWQDALGGPAEAAGDAWHPLRVAEERQATAKKPGGGAAAGAATPTGGGSSWRLWPFSGWRDGAPAAGAGGKAAAAPGDAAGSPQQDKAGGGAGAADGAGGDDDGAATPRMGSSPSATGLLSSFGLPLSRTGSVGGASSAAAGAASPSRRPGAAATAPPPPPPRPRRHIVIIRKTLMPTSDQLASLPLRFGANTISFRCSAGGTAPLSAYVYYYPWNARLVISDVDGTITRSDLLGHVLPKLGVDWSHPGITQLFHNIAGNGYQIMFLSSRAIAQANITREYLHKLVQNGYQMPSGPVIISPHGLLPSLYREIVQRRPHEFKIACLEDIRALFPPEWNPFYAGFGNRDTDVVSYREVGVPPGRTFIINPKGQISKGSSGVQSSTWSSLSAINTLVDEVFPAVQEMLYIMKGAAGGMRAAAKAALAAERLLRAAGGRAADSDGGADAQQECEGDELPMQDVQQEEQQQEQQEQEQQQQEQQQGNSPKASAAQEQQQAAQEPAQQQLQQQQSEPHQAQEAAGHLPQVQSVTASLRLATVFSAISSSRAASVLGGGSPTASEASARRSSAGGAAALAALATQRSCARLVERSSVGPQRDEFNDVQYWRPTMYFDVDAELREALEGGKGSSRRSSAHAAPDGGAH